MSDRTVRWRLSRYIRHVLLKSGEDSAFKRSYRLARRIPGVRLAWSLIDHNSHRPWWDIQRYVSNGGVFGQSLAPEGRKFPAPVAFENDGLFASLIDRIRACEPPIGEVTDTAVLVNNGLSAGGAERQIINTLVGLNARGQSAVFIGERLSGYPGQDFHLAAAVEAGLTVRPFERKAEPGNRLYEFVSRPVAEQLVQMPPDFVLEILDMVRMLRAIRPRVIHLWQDETSLKHAISGLIAGVPRIILSARNMNPTFFGYHRPYMRAAYRTLLTAPQIVLSNNSHAGAKSYAEWTGASSNRIRVVHNGLDMSAWRQPCPDIRAATRAELGLSVDDKLVLGVFRLATEKRPLLWIDAAAETLRLSPGTRFAIAGEGSMKREMMERIRKHGLARSVQLLGARKDVAALFMAADAFLLTSEQEGIPNVLLEAQWYGRPALITPAGGAVESVVEGSTGRIAASSDPSAIARDLVSMLADAELRLRAAKEGPSFVQRAFGLERMIDETLDLYSGASEPETNGA